MPWVIQASCDATRDHKNLVREYLLLLFLFLHVYTHVLSLLCVYLCVSVRNVHGCELQFAKRRERGVVLPIHTRAACVHANLLFLSPYCTLSVKPEKGRFVANHRCRDDRTPRSGQRFLCKPPSSPRSLIMRPFMPRTRSTQS